MGESKASIKKTFIQHDNKILAFVQTILKSTLCVLGWHAFLTVGLPLRMKMSSPDRFDNFVEYEHTEFAFLLSFIVLALDILWHINGLLSEKVHHAVTATILYLTYNGSPVLRSYQVMNFIMESIAPFYQLIKWRLKPHMIRHLAIFVNCFVRVPYILFVSIPMLFSDLWMHMIEEKLDKEGDVIVPWIWLLSFLCCFVFLGLDFIWTKSMLQSITRHNDNKSITKVF